MENIKFKINNDKYELNLITQELNCIGFISYDVSQICKIIEDVLKKHLNEKIDIKNVSFLRDGLQKQFEEQGYNFEFL